MRIRCGLTAIIGSMVLFVMQMVHQFIIHFRGWPEAYPDLGWVSWPFIGLLWTWSLEWHTAQWIFWTFWSWQYVVVLILFIVGWILIGESDPAEDPNM